jgi:hypothetical protein
VFRVIYFSVQSIYLSMCNAFVIGKELNYEFNFIMLLYYVVRFTLCSCDFETHV